MPQGRESPSPERQTGKQLHDPPASGKQSDKTSKEHAQQAPTTSQLDNLSSNPRGPLEDAVEQKFSRGPGNKTS